MSFIAESKGQGYEPGYFLAHEECTRETREFAQDSALAKTAENGGKYVPMGTAWPTNDGNAVGITYEDVDVTYGNMPGSVVTAGTVIEGRLAITSVSYSSVTPVGTENPKTEGWFEKSGDEYFLTADETVDSEKTYYSATYARLAAAAKTALTALGFKFVAEPAVTRPNFE